MEIKFGVKEVKKVLEEYYQKNEDFNGVSVKVRNKTYAKSFDYQGR